MKLKIGNSVYLQGYDVKFLVEHVRVHWAVAQELEAMMDWVCMVRDGRRIFSFRFDSPGAVRWLMAQDWLINFEAYDLMSKETLLMMRKRLNAQHDQEIEQFNARPRWFRAWRFSRYDEKFRRERHHLESIDLMLDYREGEVSFAFPASYDVSEHLQTKKPEHLRQQ